MKLVLNKLFSVRKCNNFHKRLAYLLWKLVLVLNWGYVNQNSDVSLQLGQNFGTKVPVSLPSMSWWTSWKTHCVEKILLSLSTLTGSNEITRKLLAQILLKTQVYDHFPIFPFVKFPGKIFGSNKLTLLYPNLHNNEVCYKGTTLFMDYSEDIQMLLFIESRIGYSCT